MKLETKNWRDNHASVSRGIYPDGSTKLIVRGRYKQILFDATVSLADIGEYPADGNVFIREYGDTAGALVALQDAGVVGRTVRIIETATTTRDPLARRPVHECKLLNVDA